ncbi:uncharacterized protein EV154DRAFT_583836 [Mucor mucedo]|uniref:uncharacterized protein n=1 Tax=Mucor mucedo TaxID=29922 RepID=UPI00221EDFF0|nr:uncharacterized protein EV154DRAFT_583836 [Mucor mucedo]KAI7893316.1 hypothetical protein EV154DRAFT_583836 [Mucor mucedo]
MENYSSTKKLINFRGTEGEDFEYFIESLYEYFGIRNITVEKQKIFHLKSLLLGQAKITFNHFFTMDLETGSYAENFVDMIKILQEKYVNSGNLTVKHYDQENLQREFDARLVEAARIAGITDCKMVEPRFIMGMHPEVYEHCVSLGAQTHAEYLKYAEGYYNAFDAPYLPRYNQPPNNEQANIPDTKTSSTTEASPNPTPAKEPTSSLSPEELLKAIRTMIKEEIGKNNKKEAAQNTKHEEKNSSHNSSNPNYKGKHYNPNYQPQSQGYVNNNYHHHGGNTQGPQSSNQPTTGNNYGQPNYVPTYHRSIPHLNNYRPNNHANPPRNGTYQQPATLPPSTNHPVVQAQSFNTITTEVIDAPVLIEGHYYYPKRPTDQFLPEYAEESKNCNGQFRTPATGPYLEQEYAEHKNNRNKEPDPIKLPEVLTKPPPPKSTQEPMEVDEHPPRKTVHSINTRIKEVKYDAAEDLLQRQPKITFEQLLYLIPSLKKTVREGIRKVSKFNIASTLQTKELNLVATMDLDGTDNTAAFTQIKINNKVIQHSLVDCGACRTIMSQEAMEQLGLEIDASSSTIFTLGNKTKQASLGLIYDVPVTLNNVTIPITMEVIPNSPSLVCRDRGYILNI